MQYRSGDYHTCLLVVFLSWVLLISSYSEASGAETYYTIQIGSYIRPDLAQARFDRLKKTLKKNGLDYLRIEKNNGFYSVRLGKFKDMAMAKRFLKTVQYKLPGAFIRRVTVLDENILILYGGKMSGKKTTILKDESSRRDIKSDNVVAEKPDMAILEGIVLEDNIIPSSQVGLSTEGIIYTLLLHVEKTEDVEGYCNFFSNREGQTIRLFSREKLQEGIRGKKIKTLVEYTEGNRSKLFWIKHLEIIE